MGYAREREIRFLRNALRQRHAGRIIAIQTILHIDHLNGTQIDRDPSSLNSGETQADARMEVPVPTLLHLLCDVGSLLTRDHDTRRLGATNAELRAVDDAALDACAET